MSVQVRLNSYVQYIHEQGITMGWTHRNIRSKTLLNILKAWDVYVNPQSTRQPAPGDTLTSYLQPSDIHSSQACTLLQHSLRQTARHMTSQQRSETDKCTFTKKIPFTIILTALHSGDSVKVCYKGRVGAKSARLLSELLIPQLLKLVSPFRSKLSKFEPKTFPPK